MSNRIVLRLFMVLMFVGTMAGTSIMFQPTAKAANPPQLEAAPVVQSGPSCNVYEITTPTFIYDGNGGRYLRAVVRVRCIDITTFTLNGRIRRVQSGFWDETEVERNVRTSAQTYTMTITSPKCFISNYVDLTPEFRTDAKLVYGGISVQKSYQSAGTFRPSGRWDCNG